MKTQGGSVLNQSKDKTKNELKRLKRADLLEILIDLGKENESLRQRLNEALTQVNQREIKLSKAGSIAQAALQLNDVFTAAEKAGAQYLENIARLSGEQEAICRRIAAKSEEKAAQLITETLEKCEKMKIDTQAQCNEMLAKAEQESKQYWNTVSEKLEALYNAREELKELLPLIM